MTNKFPIKVDVEGKEFSVVVAAELNSTQSDEMKKFKDEVGSHLAEREKIVAQRQEKTEEYEINKEILKSGSVIQKASLLLDQKKLNKEIYSLKRDLFTLDEENDSITEVLKKVNLKKYSLLVSGVDANRLQDAILASGISFETLFTFFSTEISAAKEGK